MKRRLALAAGGLILLLLLAFALGALQAQRADYGWEPALKSATYTASPPRVVIDQAHHNASTAGLTGRYWPLARLLRADGYEVRKGRDAFTSASLAGVDVLVIANASGASKPQLFGINLPLPTKGERGDPAFRAEEIDAVRSWVEHGGSLLLIADHAPFGAACAALSQAFGVTMHGGFVEVPDEVSDPLLFSRENGRLGAHLILLGDGPASAVQRVMTFTGQSLDGPEGASILLKLPASALEYVSAGSDQLTPQPAGAAQGLALERGKGRVVILGEAAMLTAQVASRKPFGMSTPGNDNEQFARNVLHWLSRRL